MAHDYNIEIRNNLDFIIRNQQPTCIINDNEYKYEIWSVDNFFHLQELYSHVDSFFYSRWSS